MFSTKHIIVLGICIVLFVVGVIFLKKINLKTTIKTMLFIGIVSEVIKVFYYIISNENQVVFKDLFTSSTTFNGYLPKTDLPFHLCSIQIIFVIILCLSNNEQIKRLLMSFMMPTCLIGGFAAIMIPTSSSLKSWILTIQYFGYHLGIMLLAVKFMTSTEIQFNVKDYKNALIFLGAMGMIAIYLNSALADYEHNVNFMYVVNPPQSGLPFLNKDHGWLVYIVHYGITAVFAVTMCYIKPIINAIKSHSKQEVTE